MIFKSINNLKQQIKGLLKAGTRAREKCENCNQRIWQNKNQTRIQKAQKPRAFITEAHHSILPVVQWPEGRSQGTGEEGGMRGGGREG